MSDLNSSKVLLVDDYDLNNRLLARALSMYQVGMVTNGEDALAMVNIDPPDLILLDINMPGIDGFEVCRRLKQRQATRDIPIIFITGIDDASVVTQGFQLGGVDYIRKPIEVTEVQARVKNHLALKKAQEELKHKNDLLEQTIVEQQLNINLARNILRIINNEPARTIDLNQGHLLFVESISKPCNQEGGDHLLVKHNPRAAKTILSLKDQSGHSVNCVLRSIITDLFYNAMAFDKECRELTEIVGRLNQTLCSSGLFQADEFCTGVMAELDHQTLVLTYVSAGHPPILVLRGDTVLTLPDPDLGPRNLPLGFMDNVSFSAGTFQLEPEDRLLIYSDGLHQLADTPDTQPLSPQELIALVQSLLTATPGLRVSLFVPALLTAIMGSNEKVAALLDHNLSSDDLSLIALEIEPKTYQAELRVKPKEFVDIDAMITHLLDKIGRALQESEFAGTAGQLPMVLTEAVLNAWKHGNRQDPNLPITLRWRFANDFSLEVIDAGAGFNFHDLPNPTTTLNLVAASGRGLFIIRKFSDAMTWLDEGRRLVLTWHHPQAMASTARTNNLALGRDLWIDT